MCPLLQSSLHVRWAQHLPNMSESGVQVRKMQERNRGTHLDGNAQDNPRRRDVRLYELSVGVRNVRLMQVSW